ncbi:site-specific integrase [uncultured Roseivirga sp.]|uniref:tyrosine-type recombinase/integrase n=1 Tax=uncultured Roseivirga sp. TaxID=543088 RepID=UPI0030D9F2D9
MQNHSMSLYTKQGQRKYLNQLERLRFLEAAKEQSTDVLLFCQLLYYTGARIAEIHNLTLQNIDISNGTVIIESLKKRKKGVFREIPIPDFLLENIQRYAETLKPQIEECLWWFSLRTASRKIKTVMNLANIKGVRSSSKSLRHGFAVHAVTNAPLTMVKKWLGHSKLETTEIYLNIVGAEERQIMKNLWGVAQAVGQRS